MYTGENKKGWFGKLRMFSTEFDDNLTFIYYYNTYLF